MTKRQGLRASVFVLLALLLVAFLSEFLRDRETTLSSLYSEPNNTVDVFVVGSSHVNSASMPGVMWQEYGVSAHNVFSWSQPMWISYHYIKEALKTQQPEVVVLNMHGMLYGNSTEQPEETDRVNYLNSFSIDTGLNRLQMLQTVAECGIDLRDPIDFLNLVRYHSRWKYINSSYFTYNAHDQQSYLKGYGLQTIVLDAEKPVYAPTEAVQEPYIKCVEYLDKIVELSEKEGFSLVFTMLPYLYQERELEFFNWIEQYAQGHDIPFINYCLGDGERIGFAWAEEMTDATHVNYKGALRISQDLGAFLAANYDVAGKEKANNAELDLDAKRLYRTLDIYEAYQQGPQGFVEWATQNPSTFVLLGEGAQLTGDAAALLRIVGLAEVAAPAAVRTANGSIEAHAGEAFTIALEGHELSARWQDGAVRAMFDEQELYSGDDVVLLYYDELLERPVYRILLTQSGAEMQEITGL